MGRYLKLKVSVDSAGADTASEVVMAKPGKKSTHARITARCPAFSRDGRGKRPIRRAGVWSRRSCFLPVNLKHGSIAARGNGLEYPTPQQSHACLERYKRNLVFTAH